MRPFATMAATLALGAAPALASEVILYDDFNCSGPYRVLIDSEADLDRTEFGNQAASVLVVAGTWTFYRDDGFQSNNGPPVTLEAGGCVNLGVGATEQFPPELMDSVQLAAAAGGPGSAIVLYDGTNLQPPYRVVTNNTPDLDAVQFDNRIASFQVLAGAWRIFRDDGFQSDNGAPIDAQGTVNDIEQLGFPRDRASSVMRLNVASDPPPPPPPQVVEVNCPPGSATNGAVCVDCTGMGMALARDRSACRCPSGQRAVGSRLVDGVTVELCQPEVAVVAPPPPTAPPTACSGNEVMVGSVEVGGGCLPCPQYSQPNAGNTQCECAPGFLQVGIETYGMPVCSPESGAQTPSTLVEHKITGWQAYQVADGRRFAFTATTEGFVTPPFCVLPSELSDNYDKLLFEMLPLYTGGHCTFVLFGDRGLRAPWEFVDMKIVPFSSGCGLHIIGVFRGDSSNPRNMQHTVEMHLSPPGSYTAPICTLDVAEITLRGPAGGDPLDAFR